MNGCTQTQHFAIHAQACKRATRVRYLFTLAPLSTSAVGQTVELSS